MSRLAVACFRALARFVLRRALRRAERALDQSYDHARSLRIDRLRAALESLASR